MTNIDETDPSVLDAPPRYAGHLMWRVTLVAQERYREAMAPLGVSDRLLSVLYMLESDGPCNQRRLGSALALDKSVMVGVIDELERIGLAKREKDATNRRANVVTVTPKGRKVVRRSLELSDQVSREYFSVLPRKRREEFFTALAELARHNTSSQEEAYEAIGDLTRQPTSPPARR